MDEQLGQMSDSELDSAIAGKTQQLQQVKFDQLPKDNLPKWSNDELDAAIGAHRQEQGYRMDQARAFVRKQAESGELPSGQQEGTGPYLARQLASFYRSPGQAIASGIMQGRLKSGTATDQDYYAMARLDHERSLDAGQSEGMKWAGFAARVPGMAQYLNPATAAAGIGMGALGSASEGQGAPPWDPKVIGQAGIESAIQLGVLKALGPIGEKLFPGLGKVGQAGIGAAQMPLSMQAADAATYFVGLQTRYGAIQDFVEGKHGDFARRVVGDAILGAAAAAAHGGPEAGKKAADAFAQTTNELGKKGLSPQEAVKGGAKAGADVFAEFKPAESPQPEPKPSEAPSVAEGGPDAAQAIVEQGKAESAPSPPVDVSSRGQQLAGANEQRKTASSLDIGEPVKTDKSVKGEPRQHFEFEVGGKPVDLKVVNRGDSLEVEWMGFRGRATGEGGEGSMRSGDIKAVVRQLFDQNPQAERVSSIRGGRRMVITRDQVAPKEAPTPSEKAPTLPDQDLADLRQMLGAKGKTLDDIKNDLASGLMRKGMSPAESQRMTEKTVQVALDAIQGKIAPPTPPEPANNGQDQPTTQPQPVPPRLTATEQHVLDSRKSGESLADIGERLNLSKQRIEQIERNARAKAGITESIGAQNAKQRAAQRQEGIQAGSVAGELNRPGQSNVAPARDVGDKSQDTIDQLAEKLASGGKLSKQELAALQEHAQVIAEQPQAMGAAAAGELLPKPGKPEPSTTRLANEQIDKERVSEGLSPIMNSARMENAEAWDAAMKRLELDPDAAKKLIASLDKPRAVDVVEGAMLLREKIKLDNEYRVLGKELTKSPDAIDTAALESRLEDLARQRTDLATAVRRTGTELGRSLQFRKQLAAEDFSLAGMLQEFRIAKGREATPEEAQKIAALQAKIEELQKQLDERPTLTEEDVRKTTGVTPEEVAVEKAKSEFRREIQSARDSRKGVGQRMSDFLVKLRQNFVISSPTTMGKIMAASAERMAIAPMEEGVGSFWRALPGFARIAAKAPREGRGFGRAEEIRAAWDGLTKGMADAWSNLKTGQSELDILHGRDKDVPREWLDLQFGLHAAAKAPAVRAEYTRSFLKRMEAMTAEGKDPTVPANLLRIGVEAYKDSQAAKFQQENWLVDAYNKMVEKLRKPDAPVASQTVGLGMKLLTPVVRIPTNLAFEIGTYAFGTATGSIQAGRAFARGIENLKPAEADVIMRQLKKGTLGLAALALGYANPAQFGGYYSSKRDEKDLKAGEAKLFGATIPSWVMHNPLLEVFQLGATIRRASDKVYKGQEQGIATGIGSGLLGLAEEIPLVRETAEVAKGLSPNARERGAFFGELAKSMAIPQLVQWLAGKMDQNAQGEPQKRKPQGVVQHVEMGVPGMRQTVPAGR